MRLILISLILISFQSYSQDSTRLVSVPYWQLNRLVNDKILLIQTDSLVNQLEATLAAKNNELSKAKQALTESKEIIDLAKSESKIWKSRFDNIVETKDRKIKQEKKRGNKKALGGFIVGALVVLVL